MCQYWKIIYKNVYTKVSDYTLINHLDYNFKDPTLTTCETFADLIHGYKKIMNSAHYGIYVPTNWV